MKTESPNAYMDINDYIEKSLLGIIQAGDGSESGRTKSHYDKHRIKLKKKRIASNLKKTTIRKKYGKFLGAPDVPDTDISGKANAMGMDSSLAASPVDVGVSDSGGWGAGDGWGITAFGEGINNNTASLLDFISELKDHENEYVLNAITDGYKAIFNSVESNSTAILCGIQPSLREFMRFNIDEFVYALNNFGGDIISLYIGESMGVESIADIKSWYIDIGVSQDIIDRIVFIEKANTEYISTSSFDLVIQEHVDTRNTIVDANQLNNLISDIYNPILIGCSDVYFMGELMLAFAHENKYTQIDRKFIYTT